MKVKKHDNCRVEVFPEKPYLNSEKDRGFEFWRDRCNDLRDLIQRHVDGYDTIEVKWDTKEVCEYCDSIWEDWKKEDNFACCDKCLEELNK